MAKKERGATEQFRKCNSLNNFVFGRTVTIKGETKLVGGTKLFSPSPIINLARMA